MIRAGRSSPWQVWTSTCAFKEVIRTVGRKVPRCEEFFPAGHPRIPYYSFLSFREPQGKVRHSFGTPGGTAEAMPSQIS